MRRFAMLFFLCVFLSSIAIRESFAESKKEKELSAELKESIKTVSKNYARIGHVYPVKGHWSMGKCNGFFWDSVNFVTNAHCVLEGPEFYVKDIDDKYYKVSAVAAHIPWRDVVVLRLAQKKWDMQPLFMPKTDPGTGDVVFTFINTDKKNMSGWKLRMGAYQHEFDDPIIGRMLKAKLNSRKGDSGSPVFNRSGALIGIVSTAGEGESNFLSIQDIIGPIKDGVSTEKPISIGKWLKQWEPNPERNYLWARMKYVEAEKADYEMARQHFLRIVGLENEEAVNDNRYSGIWYDLGMVNDIRKDYERALISFKNARESGGPNILVDYQIARLNFHKGEELYRSRTQEKTYLEYMSLARKHYEFVLVQTKEKKSDKFGAIFETTNYHLGFISLYEWELDRAREYLKELERVGSKYAADLSKNLTQAESIQKLRRQRLNSKNKTIANGLFLFEIRTLAPVPKPCRTNNLTITSSYN